MKNEVTGQEKKAQDMKQGFWVSIENNDYQTKPCIVVEIYQPTRKEVSMEPPQYDGGYGGRQKREYLANTQTRSGE
jgi:hypothetical protein